MGLLSLYQSGPGRKEDEDGADGASGRAVRTSAV